MVRLLYARCSTKAQNEARQTAYADEMEIEECYRFIDKASGKNTERPALKRLFETIELLRNAGVECDLYITELSRLGRNLKDLLELIEKLDDLEVHLHFQSENIDTTTPSGKLALHIFACVAEYQRQIINEYAELGRIEARKAGKALGRPRVNQESLETALFLFSHNAEMSVAEIVRQTGISRSTIYKEATAKGIQRALANDK